MKESNKYIHHLYNLTTIILVVINLIVFTAYALLIHYLSFPKYLIHVNYLSWTLLIDSCILLLALICSSIRFSHQVVILLIMVLEGLIWLKFPPKQLISSVLFNSQAYYLTSQKPFFADSPYYQISECEDNESVSLCKVTSLYYDHYSEPEFQLVADYVTNEIYVMRPYDQPYFALGNQSRYYEHEDYAETKDYYYELYSYEIQDSKVYVISKCKGDDWEHCKTDLHHPIMGYRFVDIMGDLTSDNLYMLLGTDGENIFKELGNETQKYDILVSGIYGCCTDTAIWGLVGVQKDNHYEYLLYESQGYLDLAPFHYTTPQKENGKLSYDPKYHLLSVIIGNKLIYTIKEHGLEDPSPLCYVEGCFVPEEK